MKLYYNQVSKTILDVKKDKRNECFNFGKDNAFPSLVEALINISVTSKTCIDRVAKAIYGNSFGKLGKVIVNSKGQTLNEVLRIAAREYAKHNNCYIQVSYDGNFDFKAIVVIPVTHVRVGKDDDKGYSGKFIVYDNWDKSKGSKIMSSSFTVIDRFNPKQKVIEKQIEAAGGDIGNYNGQLIHIKKDEAFVYSLTDLNPVLSEALIEGNSQTFRSRGSEKGFLNTKLLTTQPFASDDDRRDFKKELNGVRGADNSSEVVLLEASQQTDDLSKQIKIDDLSSPYNDKLFEYSDSQAEKNICKACGVPLILVNPSDNSMFGNSGEVLKEAKKQLFESREEDRDQLEEVFIMLMKKFQNPVEGIKILNPYEEVKVDETPKGVNAEAQAMLRGSVGGVTALLAIQQSVSAKTTTKEAGVAMIVNIYGFSEEIAAEMLGNPEIKNTETNG
jgi:hypothetical protein